MDAAEVTNVCRLCPSSGGGQDLLNVFDKTISFKYNIRDVISKHAGIDILETDLVSKKICQRCCNILYRIFEFRLDALKQDQKLREKCDQLLGEKGMKLPNTSVTIKKEILDSHLTNKKIKKEPEGVQPSTSKEELKKILHPSVADIYKNYPNLKLPTKCFERHMAPVISFPMGEVETYFKKRKLDMKRFIFKPGNKIQLSRKVAKKKTSFPTKQRTVAPLKISKKLLENREDSESSSDTYICTSVSKGRKRKISSTDSERSIESRMSSKNQPNSLPAPKSVIEAPKPTISKHKLPKISIPDSILSNSVSKTSSIRTSSPVSTNLMSEDRRMSSPAPADPLLGNSRTPSPAPADPISEDSRDSCSTNISTLNSTSKPVFTESLGLTPTVTATKSHTLLLCNLCGSVHHNASELKRHTSRHMVCQFCKVKFKSVDAKETHVDNSCQVKQMMNSPGPTISLEKIDLNLDIRKKYRDAFASCQLIPGLVEPSPMEHVILKEASPPPPIDDDIIVLSDEDDESPARSADPLSGIPTPSAHMSSQATENVVYNTVSLVRPDIRIKNNMVLNNLVENMTDKQILRELVALLKPHQPTTDEKMLQTDLPANRDIKINHSEGTCEFKNLKGQLATYKIPITISSGPFHVGYKFKNKSNSQKSMALWNDLPVIDVNKEKMPQPLTESKSALNLPSSPKSSLVKISQVPSLNASISSLPVMAKITTNPTAILSSISTRPTVSAATSIPDLTTVYTALCSRPVGESNPIVSTLNNTNVNPVNTSNSATPLLQNYALSMSFAPVISNPVPIPRTYISSALNNTFSTSNRTVSSSMANNFLSRPPTTLTISYNRSLPTSLTVGPPNVFLTNNTGPQSSSLPVSVINNTGLPSSSLSVSTPNTTGLLSSSLPVSVINSTGPITSLLPVSFTNNAGPANNSLPVSVTNSTGLSDTSLPVSTPPNRSSLSSCVTSFSSSATEAPPQQTNSPSALTSRSNTMSITTPVAADTSKFRVKSVWELQ